MTEGKLLWEPDQEIIKNSNVKKYCESIGKDYLDYRSLWEWSVNNIENFWESIFNYFNVKSPEKYSKVVYPEKMPGAKWFLGSRINFSEHFFLNQKDGTAIISLDETGRRKEISWHELRNSVSSLAKSLVELEVSENDRVAGYLANTYETIVCMLATASIGAIWSCCSSDFGIESVLDRFLQIKPKVLFFSPRYFYSGKEIDCTEKAKKIAEKLDIEKFSFYVGNESNFGKPFEDLVKKDTKAEFKHVEFNHPLWILYSSGTTGLPKPIVHSHGGILLEHLKVLSIHNDIKSNDLFFWYTSTGWMMWNYLVSGLMLGSKILLYDGNPFYPNDYSLWEIAENEGITFFGTSAPYIHACMKKGLAPGKNYRLKKLVGIGSTGSPLSPEGFEWVYKHVGDKVWLVSLSGGTDLCTAFVGGLPTLPVYSGEIQCRCLGAKVESFDENGKSVVNQVGELVITEPMPSMPLFFWNDDGKRYNESYFDFFPGVWRHGDWIMIKDRGTCIIYGRSDATIKRMGIRIGTSEIYRVVESIKEVVESIAVDTLDEYGNPRMLLFVVLNTELTEEIREKVKREIREKISPRYEPDLIIQVPEIPKTLNGKKLEVPLKKILMGNEPRKVVNIGSVSNPASLDYFYNLVKEGRLKFALRTGVGA